ncbi:MAG: autotransporter outer membrane beta-barrel domain-containing protein, partial [Verrucomicrobiales bacterium]|nr:autotransporter outer membrane beta-barrel domain-containing protein [Verrucomicrobiales bacterium]
MKTSNMKTRKLTLILTLLCALSVSALNIFAENKIVNTGTVVESGSTYAASTNQSALTVSGSGTLYEGTNLTLSSTETNQHGVFVNTQGALSLRDSTVFTSATGAYGIALTTTSSASLERVAVTVSEAFSHGIYMLNSKLSVTDATVVISASNRNGHFDGIYIGNTSEADLTNVSVELRGDQTNGISILNTATDKSTVTATGINIAAQGELADGRANVSGVTVEGNADLQMRDFLVTVRDGNAGVNTWTNPILRVDEFVTLRSGTIIMIDSGAGINVGGNGNRYVALHDVAISASGEDTHAILMDTRGLDIDDKVLLVDGGKFIAENGAALRVGLFGETSELNATQSAGANYTVTITGSAALSGTAAMEFGTTAIAPSGTAYELVNHARITVADGSTLTGATNIHGNSDVNIELTDNSALTGDLTASGSSNTTLSGSNGATITGTVSGNDNAVIDLTVRGPGSTIISDINQNDDAAVTITLDNSATGQGGYHGGNLITGSDSTWTFDKDSHGNYGENNGTWNIGDYEVIFDNMTHTGTVNISVNTDTGDGGSITVDTADGEGTVHIDTTGNGKLNPNDVLPGVVTGDGTEHWQWDPIDWGIDTIIKDGDHFIKQGTSPAGAELNSSVAIQQARWFAQQNSLLKRMGDLRFSSSRQLVTSSSDKAVTLSAANLIENIWLRSYGQQLNVGSKVSGKAYEQLIYGVDLGTDHKFTLSADSDLYLGVFAGYGRSDLDYRTPGTDGELNSYYGGLYATWLHSSGLYIDATVKAASVDNNLKAPYSGSQITANYSDVNLGGSIEIGKKFTFADDWFIEPQFQVNYLHILAEDYQAGPMSITASDLDALQFRIGSVFGRTLKLANGG